jgi:hypothetical protein
MNNLTYHPLNNSVRLLLLAMLVIALTLGAGQTSRAAAASPAPVNLGAAAPFAILTKTGITNVPTSAITGDLGVSPIAASAITGFSLVADSTNTFSRSSQVTGKIYAANYAPPTPTNLTTAVSNMETAYTNAAGRSLPDFTNLYAGNLSGRTLVPGLYKWSSGVIITTNVTLAGAPNAVWIFQIAGNLTLGAGAKVLLSGGAQANNIFWQVGGVAGVEIGTTAHVEGTILAAKAIHLRTGASLNGRALAQSAVTLAMNIIVIPSPAVVNPTPIFSDVPFTYWANSYIERVYNAGITAGCGTSPLIYCPESSVTRAQMAIFLEKGKRGSAYTPPAGTGTVFADVPLSYWDVNWIEKLFVDGITAGCGGGNYCPEAAVTRAQMAIFLLRAEHGLAYTPPAATGIFADVPTSYWDASWIEQLAREGITTGCGGGNYCPESPVTRAEMAVFLVKAFHLP